jgi:hypothetical protein
LINIGGTFYNKNGALPKEFFLLVLFERDDMDVGLMKLPEQSPHRLVAIDGKNQLSVGSKIKTPLIS